MKPLILAFLLLFGLSGNVFSTPPLDSLAIAYTKIDTLNKSMESLTNKVTTIEDKIAKPLEIKCNKKACEIKALEWIVIFFMPAVMLLFAFIMLYVLSKSDEFKFTRVIGIGNEKDKENKMQSTSRFIAVLTGLTAIFVSTTLVMYNGYLMVAQCNNAIDVDGLWKILAGLGIGVIPYGINVWNKNTKEEAATGTSTSSTTPKQ